MVLETFGNLKQFKEGVRCW